LTSTFLYIQLFKSTFAFYCNCTCIIVSWRSLSFQLKTMFRYSEKFAIRTFSPGNHCGRIIEVRLYIVIVGIPRQILCQVLSKKRNQPWVTDDGIDHISLIKIQLFIIPSYEDLTATHRRSCADDLYYFHLREFHQPIKTLHTSNFQSFSLSESGKLRFDW